MARFAKGRKSAWELDEFGPVLRIRESMGEHARLPGYRRFDSVAQARAQMVRLVSRWLREGHVAADNAARMLQQSLALDDATTAKWPLRQDIYLRNSANGLCVTSGRMAGKGGEPGDARWNKAFRNGKLLPLGLVQDDAFVLRVLAGGGLDVDEDAEWVGCAETWLDLSDGQLVLCGGGEFLSPDFDPDDPSAEDEVERLTLPPGIYRARIFSYPNGVNGSACLAELGEDRELAQAVDALCRRSSFAAPNQQRTRWVEFLLHLELAADLTSGARGRFKLDEGWLDPGTGARRPVRLPSGVPAVQPLGLDAPTSRAAWMHVYEVREALATHPAQALDDVLPWPLSRLADVFALAVLSGAGGAAELLVRPGAGAPLLQEPDVVWPDGVVVWCDAEGLHVGFDAGLGPWAVYQHAAPVAAALARLPDGSELEACFMDREGGVPGHLRCRGVLRAGVWQIGHAAPALSRGQLDAAAGLLAECAAGCGFAVAGEAEFKSAVAELCRRHGAGMLEGDEPFLQDGQLCLPEPRLGLSRLWAGVLYALRHQSV